MNRFTRYREVMQMLGIAQVLAVVVLASVLGCGASRQLTSEDIRWVDDDQYHVPEAPKERDPNYTWNFIHRSFIYPLDRFLDFPRYFGSNEAHNINALGEVPNSTWYTNRHAHSRMTREELIRGPRKGTGPDMEGTWTIIRSKTQGVTPGFNIRDARGDVYVIKFDPLDHPEMATGAEIISMLIMYAAGYNTPENYLVKFDPANLAIGEGAKVTDRKGKKRPMTDDDLQEILTRIARRPDGTIRAVASKFLSGKPIGPFSYISRRKDDPNDIYYHRHRRELRGLRSLGAWMNHLDVRGPNTLDMYVTEDGKSYVRHYMIDFGATLGSGSTHSNAPGSGHGYAADLADVLKALFTFGLLKQPWDDAQTLDHPAVGFFEAETFNPASWQPNYVQPALLEATAQDAYWGTKIVTAFTPEDIRAIVQQAEYTDLVVEDYLTETLIRRREKVGRYWYGKVNPLDHFAVVRDAGNTKLKFTDIGVQSGLWEPGNYHYELRHYKTNDLIESGTLDGTHEFVLSTASIADVNRMVQESPRDDENRFFYYRVRTERDGKMSGDVRVYLYRGEQTSDGFKVVRVERDG